MVVMVGWFSIKRILGWIFLFSCVLVTLLWTTKLMVGEMDVSDRARRTFIIAQRKAQEKLSMEQPKSKKAPPKKTVIPPNASAPLSTTVEKEYYFQPLSQDMLAPFKMNYEQMSSCFEEFKQETKASPSKAPSMEQFLWEKYKVVAIPADKIKNKKKRFIWSLRRHVALLFNEYKVRNGVALKQEMDYYEIPSCKSIGLEGREGEVTDGKFAELAGSQASLFIRRLEFPSSVDIKKMSFLSQNNNQYQMISKYFAASRGPSAAKGKNPSGTGEELPALSLGRELYALSKLMWSPNILTPICYEKTPTPKLMFPLLNGGDLVPIEGERVDYCVDQDGRALNPDETFLPRFFRQMVEAVYAIHSEGIVHLDIKPENLVVQGPDRRFIHPATSPSLRNYNLVLIDFGISRRQSDIQEDECIQEGTEPQMAPEQLMCHHSTGRPADWWSLAAAMWRIRVLWEPSLTEEERGKLSESKDPYWGHYSTPMQPFMDPQLVDLLALMLKPNPKDRDFSRDNAAINLLLNHPYLLRGRQ